MTPTSIIFWSNSPSGEEWRPIPQLENAYAVSNHGRIRRCDGSPFSRNNGAPLATMFDRDGYVCTQISLHNKGKMIRNHKFVMLLFVGPPPPRHEINHRDGNKSNNRLDNLEYITSKENLAHAAHLGLKARGERQGSSKLTSKDVFDIRALAAQGIYQNRIAEQFEISTSQCCAIVNRRSWRHLQ